MGQLKGGQTLIYMIKIKCTLFMSHIWKKEIQVKANLRGISLKIKLWLDILSNKLIIHLGKLQLYSKEKVLL